MEVIRAIVERDDYLDKPKLHLQHLRKKWFDTLVIAAELRKNASVSQGSACSSH